MQCLKDVLHCIIPQAIDLARWFVARLRVWSVWFDDVFLCVFYNTFFSKPQTFIDFLPHPVFPIHSRLRLPPALLHGWEKWAFRIPKQQNMGLTVRNKKRSSFFLILPCHRCSAFDAFGGHWSMPLETGGAARRSNDRSLQSFRSASTQYKREPNQWVSMPELLTLPGMFIFCSHRSPVWLRVVWQGCQRKIKKERGTFRSIPSSYPVIIPSICKLYVGVFTSELKSEGKGRLNSCRLWICC